MWAPAVNSRMRVLGPADIEVDVAQVSLGVPAGKFQLDAGGKTATKFPHSGAFLAPTRAEEGPTLDVEQGPRPRALPPTPTSEGMAAQTQST